MDSINRTLTNSGAVKTGMKIPSGRNVTARGAVHGEKNGDFVDLSGEKPKRFQRIRDAHDIIHEEAEAAHIGVEIAAACGATGKIAAASCLAAAGSGIFFGIEGVKDVKKAITEKDIIGGLEASGHLGLAAESAVDVSSYLASTSAAGRIFGKGAAAFANSGLLATAGMAFGLIHGGAEVIIGGKEVYEGVKGRDKKKILSGALNIGVGAGCAAVAAGGGVPVGVALGAVFLTKVAIDKKDAFVKAGKNTAKWIKNKFNNFKGYFTR